MNEAGVGRVLPASLHQGIADLLPSRLEFYEEWLNPKAMRDGRIGVAPLTAVFSFLRREGDVYQAASARAGEYAAEWTFSGLPAISRLALRAAPAWLRLRLVARLMGRLSAGTYRECRTSVDWEGTAGTLVLVGSLFCSVREPAGHPLCDYYAAAMRRLMALCGMPADVAVEECRATGAAKCRMRLTVQV